MTTIAASALLNLSDLSGRIDIQGFYESHGVNVAGKPVQSRHDGQEWAGSCPHCPGSTDRFHFWESGRFSCSLRSSGCGWHGSSPYYFLRDQGYDHQQALAELGIDQSEVDSYSQKNGNKLPLEFTKDEAPCQKWQEQAHLMCHVWEKVLWSDKGKTARDYLHSRGFKDDTIKQAHLGLNPSWHIESLETWGLSAEQLGKEDDPQIKIPRGITIPWHVENSVWKLQIRRPEPGPDGKKYKEILGSVDALYNLDSLKPGQSVLLVESELDALSAQQEASDLVIPIATGSTAKGRASRWIGKLKQAPLVLQAFDIDENRAGERAADEWLKALPDAMRWTPWAHDVNDMLRDGQSIHEWIEAGLQIAQVELPEQGEAETREEIYDGLVEQSAQTLLNKVESAPPALEKNNESDLIAQRARLIQQFQERPCIACGGTDWMIDYDGHLVCPCILEKRKQALLPRQPLPAQTVHLCPHCQKAKRISAGGFEIVRQGTNHPWNSIYKKLPGGPFVYVWVESQQFWICPGCLDQQKSFSI